MLNMPIAKMPEKPRKIPAKKDSEHVARAFLLAVLAERGVDALLSSNDHADPMCLETVFLKMKKQNGKLVERILTAGVRGRVFSEQLEAEAHATLSQGCSLAANVVENPAHYKGAFFRMVSTAKTDQRAENLEEDRKRMRKLAEKF